MNRYPNAVDDVDTSSWLKSEAYCAITNVRYLFFFVKNTRQNYRRWNDVHDEDLNRTSLQFVKIQISNCMDIKIWTFMTNIKLVFLQQPDVLKIIKDFRSKILFWVSLHKSYQNGMHYTHIFHIHPQSTQLMNKSSKYSGQYDSHNEAPVAH